MRGALQLDGVREVAVTPGTKEFEVAYDPTKITVEQMLASLRRAKGPAQVR